jgi:hypothetical protein
MAGREMEALDHSGSAVGEAIVRQRQETEEGRSMQFSLMERRRITSSMVLVLMEVTRRPRIR